jgi:hypothetical protein
MLAGNRSGQGLVNREAAAAWPSPEVMSIVKMTNCFTKFRESSIKHLIKHLIIIPSAIILYQLQPAQGNIRN